MDILNNIIKNDKSGYFSSIEASEQNMLLQKLTTYGYKSIAAFEQDFKAMCEELVVLNAGNSEKLQALCVTFNNGMKQIMQIKPQFIPYNFNNDDAIRQLKRSIDGALDTLSNKKARKETIYNYTNPVIIDPVIIPKTVPLRNNKQSKYVPCTSIPLFDDEPVNSPPTQIAKTSENSSAIQMHNDVNINFIKILHAQQVNSRTQSNIDNIGKKLSVEELEKKIMDITQNELDLKNEITKLKSEIEEVTTERNILRALLLKKGKL